MSLDLLVRVFAANFGRATVKLVALKLADHGADDGTGIRPSVARIAAGAEVAPRTVQRILKQFVAHGLLRRVRPRCGRGEAREYVMDLEMLARLENPDGPTFQQIVDKSVDNPVDNPVDEIGPRGNGCHGVTLNEPNGCHGVTLNEPKGCHGVTLTNTRRKHYNARAPRCASAGARETGPDLGELRAALCEAAGAALGGDHPGLASLGVPLGWIAAGHDLDRVILPAIRARAETCRPGQVAAWSYFTGPVQDMALRVAKRHDLGRTKQ